MNPSRGAVDAGFDTSSTAANLIADATGYTLYRRISWALTNSSSNIINWDHSGSSKHYAWDLMTVQLASAGSTSGANIAVQVPPSQEGVIMAQNYITTAVTNYFLLTQTDQANSTPSSVFQTVRGQNDAGFLAATNTNTINIKVNADSQIRQRTNETASFVYVSTVGWIDDPEQP